MTFAAMKNLQSQILSLEILSTFATEKETLAFLENNNLEILLTLVCFGLSRYQRGVGVGKKLN